MRKKISLILIALVAGLAVPTIALAVPAGLVATPSIEAVDGVFYLPVGETVSFRIRYCGHPGGGNDRDVELKLQDDDKTVDSGKVTNLAYTDAGDGRCEAADKVYHGNTLTLSWKAEDQYDKKDVSLNVCDEGVCRSPMNFKIDSPPEGDPSDGDDPPPPVGNNLNLDRDNFYGWEGVFSNIFKLQDGLNTPSGIANKVLEIFLKFVAIAAVVVLIYAGWIYVTSGGDSAKAEKGKKAIIGSIIGIIIVMLTFTIIRFISNLL